jgi:hypothetical protein
MAYCHAGVLLLTESAINSDWVLKEATILAWRAALDPAFRLFVVQMPHLQAPANFEPLMLQQLQRISSGNPVDIAKVIIEELANIALMSTPLDSLVSDLSILLGQVDPKRRAEIRSHLELPEPPWRPSYDDHLREAALMARHLLRGKLGNYAGVQELVDDLARVTANEVVAKIFRILAPYWVPGELAGFLPALGIRMPKRAAIIVGSYLEYTCQMYVQRAHCGSMLPKTISIAADSSGDLGTHISASVCQWYRGRTRSNLNDDEVIKELRKPTRIFRYVLVPLLPPADVIDLVVQKFPTLRFIFGVGINPESDEQTRLIIIAVDREIEYEQYQAYLDVEDLLGSLV